MNDQIPSSIRIMLWSDEAWKKHLILSEKCTRYGSVSMNPWFWYQPKNQPFPGAIGIIWLNQETAECFMVKFSQETMDKIQFSGELIEYPVREEL